MWRFESVHSFASVGNLYQKMHFAGSNLYTDPKCPKCIYKISKNFRVENCNKMPEKSLDISGIFALQCNFRGCIFFDHSSWLGWPDSDRRMRESKSRALPLGYTPVINYINHIYMTLIHYITYNDAMSSVFLLFMEVKVKINFKGMKIRL